jgi:hypothetical protein
MERLLGKVESDPYRALMHVLDAVKEGKRVGAAPCYLHLVGVSGFPQFIARMQPSYIMRSEDAFDEIPLAGLRTVLLSNLDCE